MGKGHARGEDTYLAKGTANEVTAANAKLAVDSKHLQNTDKVLLADSEIIGYGASFITGGTASAISSMYPPGTACNLNINDYWYQNTYMPAWWKYDLGVGVTKTARKLRLIAVSGYLHDFTLQGSNDDSIWADLYSGTQEHNDNWQEYLFANAVAYRYYRLYMTSGDITLISEIEICEALGIVVNTLIDNGELKEDLSVDSGKKIDGRDLSVDGIRLDQLIMIKDFTFLLGLGTPLVQAENVTNALIVPKDGTILKAFAYAKTAPTDADVIFDIKLNGTSIWNSTPANRLTIAASANSGTQENFDTIALVEGDIITIDIDQVGSTIAGQDVTVVLHCQLGN